jgi:hypothetical protein
MRKGSTNRREVRRLARRWSAARREEIAEGLAALERTGFLHRKESERPPTSYRAISGWLLDRKVMTRADARRLMRAR